MKTGFPIHPLPPSLTAAIVTWLLVFTTINDAAEPMELSIAHDEYIYMIRFSPDGKMLATAAGDNVARIWNWPTRELLHTLEHDAAVYAAAFSPTADLLSSGSGDGIVSLWKASTGRLVAQRQEHADAVYCLSYTPDGKQLSTIGGDGKKGDTRCRIWSLPTLQVTKVLPGHDRPAYSVQFGPPTGHARTLATAGGDKRIHIYDLASEKRLTLEGHTSDVYRCCFSPDGGQLASTSQDGSVRLWDVATGKPLTTLIEVKDPMYDVAFSHDGRVLAAVGDDGIVRFWNAQTYELLLESRADKEGLYTVTFTPDQTSVLTGGVRGKVYECPVPMLDTK